LIAELPSAVGGNSIGGKLGRGATEPSGAKLGNALPHFLTFEPMRIPQNAVTRATQSRYEGTDRLEAVALIQAEVWIALPADESPK